MINDGACLCCTLQAFRSGNYTRFLTWQLQVCYASGAQGPNIILLQLAISCYILLINSIKELLLNGSANIQNAPFKTQA
jgi:hypothetical protein